MTDMKYQMARWDRNREWMARRFAAGWVCMVVSVVIAFDGWDKPAAVVALLGLGLLASTRY